jgi:DNA-binding transcriptional LysR family regulator
MNKRFQDDNVSLEPVRMFVRVVEEGGFTAAARSLGLTPAALSRGVSRLEAALGATLLRRTTRRMMLTDDGRAYFEQCRTALAQINEAQRALQGKRGKAQGVLRVSAPSTYAQYRLLPRLPGLLAKHPELSVEVHIASRNVDFIEEGFDCAIRLGEPPDSRLVAVKLEDAALGFYASAAYLKARGTPTTLAQLHDARTHTLLPFVLPSTGRVLPWLVREERREAARDTEFTPQSRVRISEEPLGCVALASADAGVVQTFDWIARAQHPPLKPVLKNFAGRSRPFYLLYPQHRHLSPNLRALSAFLRAA